MSDLSIDVSYIGRLSSRLEQFKKVRRNVWVARCPICGDSKKKKFKKRFYIFFHKGKYTVKCHNCGYTNVFSRFLEAEFPDEYREYMIEKFPQKSSLKKNRFKHIKDIVPKKVICNGFDYSVLKRFDELPTNHPARIYIENRKIPLNMVYYCDTFSKFIDSIGVEHYKLAYGNSKEPRMIIPFYREDGLSTVFQARAFSKKEFLRYITIKEDDSENKIYGLERVDKNKPVWCLEGPLDSLMIPNAIAMSGISTKLPIGVDEFRFVFDNEPRNIDVVKNMRKRLRGGHKVVILSERVKYNDLNDMIVKGEMSSEKVLDLLENNLYTKDIGLMKLNEWKR